MNPNQIPFGEGTASAPNESLDNTQPVQPTETDLGVVPPADEPQAPVEAQPTPDPAPTTPEPEKKKKSLFPIIIAVIAIVAAIAIIAVAVILSNNSNSEQPKQDNPETSENPTTEEPKVETIYAAKDRLSKKEYTSDDLNNGITLDKEGKYTFTASPTVKFKRVATNAGNVLLHVFVTHEDIKDVPIAVEVSDKDIESLDKECAKTKGCESDYIEGAKTLFISQSKVEADKKTHTVYSFYSKSDNILFKYDTVNSYTAADGVKEAIMRNIMVKAAMTMSGESNKPYVYDIATFFKIPNDKHVKSYENITAVDYRYIKIEYTSGKTKNDIFVYHKRIEGVAITDASNKPRIGGFMYNDMPGFRYYLGEDETIDVIITTSTSKSKASFVKEVSKLQEIIDKIDE